MLAFGGTDPVGALLQWGVVGLVVAIVAVIVLAFARQARRVKLEHALRLRGTRGPATLVGVHGGSYGGEFKYRRMRLQLQLPSGSVVSYAGSLEPSTRTDNLAAGMVLPVAWDPADPTRVAVLWEETNLGIRRR
jgi:hypothetical protein